MGVTIPDTADFGRPVPRATPAIQSYGVTQPVQQDVAAWTYAAQSAKAAADSDAAVMKQTAAEVDKFSLSLDTTAAQDALNKLRGQRQELTSGDGGYMRVEGGDVLKKGPDGQTIYEAYPQKLQSSMDEIGGKLQSPRAQKLFQQAAANELLAYKSEVARHGLTQTEKYQGAVFKDTAATLADRALLSADDPKALEAVVSSLEQATLARAAQLGVPGEAMARGVVSDVYKAVIKRAIDSGDSAKALGAFEAYKGKLDGKDTLALEDQIKTLRTADTAKTQATEMLSGLPATERAEQGTKQSLQFWTAGGYTQKVSAGITAGFLRESQFYTGAVNPRDGRDGSDSINIGQWNQARATAFKEYARKNGLDPNDMATGLKYAKAEIDGEIPYSVSGLSPDFKARLQNAKTEKEAADIMTRGYFRPKYTEGESAHRQKSASQILAKYGTTDPLRESVDTATGTVAPKNGPQYIDTRQMLLDADTQYDAATRRNMEVNATNETQRRATQTQLDLNLATQKRQIETTKLQLDINVDKWMQTGGPNGGAATTRPPPEIWNQLHYEKQKSIDATLVHNAKGTDAVTDQQVWYDLQRGLTSEDPKVREEYANKPLWEYKAKLSNQDFQEIAKMQGTVRKGDPDKQLTHVRNINQMVDDTLNKLGIDPTPTPSTGTSSAAARSAKFRRSVQDALTALEAQTGKKSTPEQQQKIIDTMAMEVVTKKGWFWDDTKPLFDITIDTVPKEDRAEIESMLRRRGGKIDDATILRLYKAWKVDEALK